MVTQKNNKRNIGLTRSLNKGLQLARDEYIARMDADDIMLPTRLAKQVEFLDANPEIAVVGSHLRLIDEEGKYIKNQKWPIGLANNLCAILTGHNPVGHPSVMYRRYIIRKIGNYRGELNHAQDLDLWMRLYTQGYRTDNIDDYLILYRVHTEQGSIKKKEVQMKSHRLVLKSFLESTLGTTLSNQKIKDYLDVWVRKNAHLDGSSLRSAANTLDSLYTKLRKRLNLTRVEQKEIQKYLA